jgi:hypothetical protein
VEVQLRNQKLNLHKKRKFKDHHLLQKLKSLKIQNHKLPNKNNNHHNNKNKFLNLQVALKKLYKSKNQKYKNQNRNNHLKIFPRKQKINNNIVRKYNN